MFRLRTSLGAPNRRQSRSVEPAAHTSPFLAIYDACASPSEGEAQASYMAKKGLVWAAGSTDLDCLLFGAPRLVRNLNITGRRKIAGTSVYRDVVPELIELQEVLSKNGLTQE